LLYSVTDRTSFERLETFRQSMLRIKPIRPIFILAGNKIDRVAERQVSKEEGYQMAQQFGCEFLEISARTALNVENLFLRLVRALRPEKMEQDRRPRRNPTKRLTILQRILKRIGTMLSSRRKPAGRPT
jgi:GTPase KRas